MTSVTNIVKAICAWRFSSEHRPEEVETVLLAASSIAEENQKLKNENETALKMVQEIANTAQKEINDLRYALEVITPYAAKSRMSGIADALEEANNAINKSKGIK